MNKLIALMMVFLMVSSSFVSAIDFSVDASSTTDALSNFEETDIILNVDSYHPTVLSEQAFESDQPGGYAIFATLTGLKTNPFMDLQRIYDMKIRATGESTKYVRSIYYKKPKSGYFDLNNMGYVVIRLQNLKEDEVPDQLDISMDANIVYEIQNGFGINEQDLILPVLNEDEFLNKKSEYSFWSGRGNIRLAGIRGSTANFIVYDGRMNKRTVSVGEGKKSGKLYLTGGTPYLLFDKEESLGRNLRDTYRIRVNQITGNKDIANVEMSFNGEYKLKNYVVGQYLYEGSRWKVKTLDVTGSEHKVKLYNENTREELILEGGKFYIPSLEEEKSVLEYEWGQEVSHGNLILNYANKRNIDAALIAAVLNQETAGNNFNPTGFNSNVISKAGAVGLMQIMPTTALSEIGANIKFEDENGNEKTAYSPNQISDMQEELMNPEYNIKLGTGYLKKQLDVFKTKELALAAYNAGSGRVKGWRTCIDDMGAGWEKIIDDDKIIVTSNPDINNNCHLPKETFDYVPSIMKENGLYDEYKKKLETTSTKLSDVISEDKDKKDADDKLKPTYFNIKKKLEDLKDNNNLNEITPVINEYKNFLIEVDKEGIKDLSNKYRSLIIDDLVKFEKNIYDSGKIELNQDLMNYIADNLIELREYSKLEEEKKYVEYAIDSSKYYYEKAISQYREVVESYPGVVDPTSGDKENPKKLALEAQLQIAKIYDRELEEYAQAIEEYKKFILLFGDTYQNIKYIESRINFLEVRKKYFSNKVNLFENGNTIELKLWGGDEASADDKAVINVNGNSKTYLLKSGENNLGSGWYLTDINIDYVKIAQQNTNGNFINTKTLRMGDRKSLSEGTVFILEDIDMKQQVHISILPGEEKLTTKSTFMLHIPVEPRLWKLSTEQMNKHIDATQKTIDFLNKGISIVEGVYKWWSIGCYSTFIYVMAKNSWFSSLLGNKGDSLARKDVMDSWKKTCAEDVSKKKMYDDVFDCVVQNEEKINADLEGVSKILESSSGDKIKQLAELPLTNIELKNKYDQDYLNYKFVTEVEDTILNGEADAEGKDSFNKFKKDYPDATVSQLKAEERRLDELYHKKLFEKEYKDESFKDIVDEETFDNFKKGISYKYDEDSVPELISKLDLKIEGEKVNINDIKPSGNNLKYYGPGGPYFIYQENSDDSFGLLKLNTNKLNTNKLEGETLYYWNGNEWITITPITDAESVSASHDQRVSLISSGKWKNRIDKISVDSLRYLYVSKRGSDGEILEVELWERYSDIGPKDNLPLESKTAYRIRQPFSIDSCTRGFTSGREGVDYVSSLTETYKTLEKACNDLLVIDKQSGLRDYEKGDKLNNYAIEYAIHETGGLQCFDVMGIDDCLTLFSACDPVMCPASRFTAGGKWKVDNVVSTGIFGSIFLGTGLWRSKPIPEVGICVPGIDAGLKNWKTIAQGYQECLIARRDNGENVGICDVIRNVGICKIAWREGTAFLQLTGGALDKIMGAVGEASGGDEMVGSYFQKNMQQTSDFVKFFTKEYATTYFSAYRGASTDEIGEKLCEAAIYAKVPGVGGFLDQLTRPEGPVQFTGFFTEMPHSDLGGEIYSDYEVYYHIYAGEDKENVRYYVYLKDVDDLNKKRFITRTTGYLKRGDFVDETIRVQDVTGYDELCIVVDNQEHCGFGKVSSGILDDYLQDKALKAEYEKEIKTEQECRGGSSVLSNPSVSELADAFYPNINRNGLVRVCSRENPGKGVDNFTWREVGTCGVNDLGQDLGSCWLSKQSYTDALSEYNLEARSKAEELFKEISENLFTIEQMKVAIAVVIGEREGFMNTWDGLLSSNNQYEIKDMVVQFSDVVTKFEELKENTIEIEWLGKLEYEIGETYYILAGLLEREENKKEAEEAVTVSDGVGVKRLFMLFEFDSVGFKEGYGFTETNFKEELLEIYDPEIDALTIYGYASVDGTEEYNNGLSLKRVEEVKKLIFDEILIEKYDQELLDMVSPHVIVRASGETDQFDVVGNTVEQNYELNRRVVLVIDKEFFGPKREEVDLASEIEAIEGKLNPSDCEFEYDDDSSASNAYLKYEDIWKFSGGQPLNVINFVVSIFSKETMERSEFYEKLYTFMKNKDFEEGIIYLLDLVGENEKHSFILRKEGFEGKQFSKKSLETNSKEWAFSDITNYCVTDTRKYSLENSCSLELSIQKENLPRSFALSFFSDKWYWKPTTSENYELLTSEIVLKEKREDVKNVLNLIISNDNEFVVSKLVEAINKESVLDYGISIWRFYREGVENPWFNGGRDLVTEESLSLCLFGEEQNKLIESVEAENLLDYSKDYVISVKLKTDEIKELNFNILDVNGKNVFSEYATSTGVEFGADSLDYLNKKDRIYTFIIYDEAFHGFYGEVVREPIFVDDWLLGIYVYTVKVIGIDGTEETVSGKFTVMPKVVEDSDLEDNCQIKVEFNSIFNPNYAVFTFYGGEWYWKYNIPDAIKFFREEQESFKKFEGEGISLDINEELKYILSFLDKSREDYETGVNFLVRTINIEDSLYLVLKERNFEEKSFRGIEVTSQQVYDFCSVMYRAEKCYHEYSIYLERLKVYDEEIPEPEEVIIDVVLPELPTMDKPIWVSFDIPRYGEGKIPLIPMESDEPNFPYGDINIEISNWDISDIPPEAPINYKIHIPRYKPSTEIPSIPIEEGDIPESEEVIIGIFVPELPTVEKPIWVKYNALDYRSVPIPLESDEPNFPYGDINIEIPNWDVCDVPPSLENTLSLETGGGGVVTDSSSGIYKSYSEVNEQGPKVIVIDPGHGGYDPGAIALDGSYEKTHTLQYSKHLKSVLENRGFDVYLTRETDVALDDDYQTNLQKRVDFAIEKDADLFLSIHFNSAENPEAKGTQILYCDYLSVPNLCNPYSVNCAKTCAESILDKLSSSFGVRNSGLNPVNNLKVVKSEIPSLILEIGFLSNPDNLAKIKNNNMESQVMQYIADSLYFDCFKDECSINLIS